MFQRLAPAEPEATPFALDAWLRLETQLDKAVIERAVRRRLWRYFAAEVAVVILVALGWLLFVWAGFAQTEPLDFWRWRNPSPQGNTLHRVAFLNGRFIATGEVGAASWAIELQPKSDALKKVFTTISLKGDASVRSVTLRELNGDTTLITLSPSPRGGEGRGEGVP